MISHSEHHGGGKGHIKKVLPTGKWKITAHTVICQTCMSTHGHGCNQTFIYIGPEDYMALTALGH